MSGKAFISVSGIDKTKADELLSMASQFLYDIYYEKFIDGETLLRQMKDKVSECSVFIFFASRNSLESVWCNFELDLAELEVIKRGIKVYVFPIEKDIPFSSIPAWMRAYWIDMEPRNARVGARRLSKIFRKELIPPILQGAVERIEDVNRARISHMKQYQCAPNVFFFSGPPLIGRRTTLQGFLAKSFGQGHFENGPEILLDDPASLEDLYLRLKSELKPIEKSKYEKEKMWYSSLSFDDKVEEIIKILQEISKNKEAVFFICQSGFFDENGYLTLWARKIFDKLLYKEEIKIAIISNRQPRSEDIFGMKNVLSYNISQLENKFVLALVEELSLDRIGKVHSLEKEYIPVIGGHPVLAYAYVDLLKQNISSSVDSIIGIISSEQRNIMGDFLSYDKMSGDERCALSVLSWVPRIEAESILEILKKCSVSDGGEVLKRMVLKHLANWDGEFFSIAGPIRFAFRQLHGFGDAKVLESISSYFSDKFEESDNLDNEFVDRALFVISMERGVVPDNFKNIISVNTVLKTASSLYRRGRYEKDKVDLNRALDLCNLALTLKTERHIHRELLGVKIRCLLKLNRLPEADREIEALEKSVDRDTAILRAQYYRASNDIPLANSSFKLAISAGNNSDSVLHEYCTCLKKIGNYKEIYRIIDTYSRRVQKNAFLLDLKISLEIGRGDFPEAEETIKTLRSHPEDNYKSFRREAILVHRRDKNLPKAEAIINAAITRAESEGGRVPLDLYITRCIIRAHLHKEKETTEDFVIIRNRCIDPTTIENGLSLYILACKHQYSDVFRQINNDVNDKKSNVIIMRDIFQIMEEDDDIPGFEKAEASIRLRDLLPFPDKITAFDIIGD